MDYFWISGCLYTKLDAKNYIFFVDSSNIVTLIPDRSDVDQNNIFDEICDFHPFLRRASLLKTVSFSWKKS